MLTCNASGPRPSDNTKGDDVSLSSLSFNIIGVEAVAPAFAPAPAEAGAATADMVGSPDIFVVWKDDDDDDGMRLVADVLVAGVAMFDIWRLADRDGWPAAGCGFCRTSHIRKRKVIGNRIVFRSTILDIDGIGKHYVHWHAVVSRERGMD
jgi:hypothetical protein